MKRDDATEAQVGAADPRNSTWLAANAGSGKTRVLTDRVARLLLEGAQPQRILCLTYTKAAASEMQNRLFGRLGEWAMLGDAALQKALRDLGQEGELNASALRAARTLFARAIETPGGLKIQTIHSFCASILRRFPIEAGVSPGFKEMEDRAAALLLAEIVQDMAEEHPALVRDLAAVLSDPDFTRVTGDIVAHRGQFEPALSQAELSTLLNLPADLTAQDVVDRVYLGDEDALIEPLIAALLAGSSNDQKAAQKLKGLNGATLASLETLEEVFLTGSGAKEPYTAKIGSFPTKATRAALADILPRVEDLMRRVEDTRDLRLKLSLRQKTAALHAFAATFLPIYEARKMALGWLDFDDLILKTRDLLTDPGTAAWVLYRLDGGIDHILVDEAQDTSPAQWKVVELLAQEFTSGQGARPDTQRTIFVVGDKKQSIYSFQGADPREFDRMQAEFATRLQDTGHPLVDRSLAFSFRSAEAILQLVDETLLGKVESGFGDQERHRAFKSKMPGRVDLWPAIEPTKSETKSAWSDPVDLVSEDHHSKQLARQIADQIKDMIDNAALPDEIGHTGEYRMRRVRPGDVMVLVQRRSTLFAEIIRACKEANLPIAGADRLKVGAELAVRDLAELMSFLDVTEDDLSLAVALKSPLFGWTEQMLFDLANRRKKGSYLWQALRQRADEFPDTMVVLNDLRGQTDFLRPYDLIERILTRHNGRKNLLARLGAEAEDGINAFLAQALSFERNAIPSLTGFLQWMETDDLEIKRQMDSAGDLIRVMTVHGAKGLEAPIVILPDTTKRDRKVRSSFLKHQGKAVWAVSEGAMPQDLSEIRGNYFAAEEAESDRLLYVAMTRAEKWLIVTAAGDVGKDGTSWYEKITAGMQRCGGVGHVYPSGAGTRFETGDWGGKAGESPATASTDDITLPAFFTTDAPVPASASIMVAPSDLGGAKALGGDAGLDEETAKKRGRQIHTLLEHLAPLPAETWPDMASRILSQGADRAEQAEHPDLLAEARGVLEKAELAHLFAADTLAEVPLSAPLDDTQTLNGIADRLIVTDTSVLVIDFKTNAIVPNTPDAVPEGILRQMGAYSCALQQIYPDRAIQTGILWTRNASLMMLPDAVTHAALNRFLNKTP